LPVSFFGYEEMGEAVEKSMPLALLKAASIFLCVAGLFGFAMSFLCGIPKIFGVRPYTGIWFYVLIISWLLVGLGCFL
jgi:hypothetical protein